MWHNEHQFTYLFALLNIYDQSPLPIISVKGKFDNMLILIYIGDAKPHVGEVVNNLGNTETVSHAFTPSTPTNSWFVSRRGDGGKCSISHYYVFSISYLFNLEPNE